MLEPSNKKCLFILGMLFVKGVKIKILNEKDLNLEETNKSFSMMPYVWSKIGDSSFPAPDYSNVKTEMDKRVENNIKIIAHLDSEINDLEEAISNVKNENEILRLNIQKKELILQKLEIEKQYNEVEPK